MFTSFQSRASSSEEARKCLSCSAVYESFLEIEGYFFKVVLSWLRNLKITKVRPLN